jgi:hypothetical protein
MHGKVRSRINHQPSTHLLNTPPPHRSHNTAGDTRDPTADPDAAETRTHDQDPPSPCLPSSSRPPSRPAMYAARAAAKYLAGRLCRVKTTDVLMPGRGCRLATLSLWLLLTLMAGTAIPASASRAARYSGKLYSPAVRLELRSSSSSRTSLSRVGWWWAVRRLSHSP